MIKLDKTYFQKLYNVKHDPKQIEFVLSELKKEMESGEVGYYKLHETMRPVLKEIKSYVKSLPKEIDTFLLIGIGGSALGPQAIDQALRTHKTKKKFVCLDNTDPDLITDILATVNPKQALVNVISKSGGTLETMANFSIINERFESVLGEDVYKHYVFTTDPIKSRLKDFGEEKGIQCFWIPSNIGGRFSVLSPVGLLMSEFMGYDTEAMLDGAKKVIESVFKPNIDENPVLDYALLKYHAYKKEGKLVSVMMPYSSKLANFSAWYKQLWGESLGKRFDKNGNEIFTGQTPVQAVGSIDQHSILQYLIEGPNTAIITFIKALERKKINIPKHPMLDPLFSGVELGKVNVDQLDSTTEAVFKEERLSLCLSIDQINEGSISALFLFKELTTSTFGILESINTYDQPGVELGKCIIREKYKKVLLHRGKEV